MAHRLIWSPQALDDIDGLAAFIARDSRVYAGRMVRRIRTAAQQACVFPRIGRKVPEYGQETVREVIAKPYRVIYRIGQVDVSVIAVIHGARDLSLALRDRTV